MPWRDLLSEDHEQSADALERLVLGSMGITPGDDDLQRWSRAYEWLSTRLNTEAEEGFGVPSGLLMPPKVVEWQPGDLEVVWGIVYAARTFQVARRVLTSYPPPSGPHVEIGAGWGPCALVATMLAPRTESLLIDLSSDRLAHAAKLFEAAGLRAPKTAVQDAARAHLAEVSAISVPYSLAEMVGDEESVDRPLALVRSWLAALREGGRMYILEPGTRSAARRLQQLRDALVSDARILGPCTGALRCPLLANDRDWCHFTWRIPLGPIGQRIAARARRRAHELHFSWLVLERSAPERGLPERGRVLEVRESGPGKRSARVCMPSGAVTLTALKRQRSSFERLGALEPGTRVAVDQARLVHRGDGARIEDPSAVIPTDEL